MSKLTATLAIVIALIVGLIVGRVAFSSPGSPRMDGNPVGFNLLNNAQGMTSTGPVTTTMSGSTVQCVGTNTSCILTVRYLRATPAACASGDTSADCSLPTACPSGAECIHFSGPLILNSIDYAQTHRPSETVTASGLITLQSSR